MKRYIKSSTYDICDMVGEQFTVVRDTLTALNFYETEYGDTSDGNGYAVYRSRKNPDVEYTVEYEWVSRPNRKNSYRAGAVLHIDCPDDYVGSSYTVKSSSATNEKRYIRSTVTDPYLRPDIVLYVNNKHIYEGDPHSYELGYAIKKLCMNSNVRESFIDWLIERGIPEEEFDYDPSATADFMAEDVAYTVAAEITYCYGEDEDFYLDGMGCINLECFLANDEVGASTKMIER